MTKQPYLQQLVFIVLFLTLSGVVCQQVVLENHDYPTVSIEGSGPSYADLNETVTQALSSCQVREFLNGTRHRVLSSEFHGDPMEYGGTKATSEVYRATVYDYTHGRSIIIRGIPFDPSAIFITETGAQPNTNAAELGDAARIVGLRSYEALHVSMPPVITKDFPDGRSQRILNLAITSANSTRGVHVNMNNGTVESPDVPSEKPLACEGPEPAPGDPTGRGVPGTANLRITKAGKELWTFQAVRPSSSSGTRASGIELRNVKYKGKTVLYRAHVPILNVEYERGCGPFYRDWQWEEFFLKCKGSDITPGFRRCKSPAKTILDPPFTDGGSFRGVAVYVEGQEVVLKAQLTAAWYRYIPEWRFHVNGSLKPRWGFAGVLDGSECICQVHTHHVYWRFDFDIVTAGNNLVREFNNPPIIGTSNYHNKVYEIKRPRDASRRRHWEISNTRTGSAYSLIPGLGDGTSTRYGVGDLWVLRYYGTELDDGVDVTGGDEATTRANIDKFVNGEPVVDKDVVVWYAAHFKHDHSHNPDGAGHIVGPDIRPIRW